jgi:hypothetical protein
MWSSPGNQLLSIRPFFAPVIRAVGRVDVAVAEVRVRNGLVVRVVPIDEVDRFDWTTTDDDSGRRCILRLKRGGSIEVMALYQAPAGRATQLNNEILRLRG